MRNRLTAVIGLTGAALLLCAGTASADPGPVGVANNSPGVVSGDVIQVPIHVPVNVCGDTIDVLALLNPASGSDCQNK